MPPTRLVATAVVLALAVIGCSGGDDDDAARDDTKTSSAEFEHAAVELEVTSAELVSPHQPLGPLEEKTSMAVTGVVDDLLLITSAGPLVEGKARGGFAKLFTPDAGARAAGPDRAVFFDEGVPRFGKLKPEEATVQLTALAGSMDPATALVVAKFAWKVASTDRPGDRVEREGELQLVPDDG